MNNCSGKTLVILFLIMSAFALASCGSVRSTEEKAAISYHFADREEAIECYLASGYLDRRTSGDIQFTLQDKNGTVEQMKDFVISQMIEFSEEEKAELKEVLSEMNERLIKRGFNLPDVGEITFARTTMKEESGGSAYTLGTCIFLGDKVFEYLHTETEYGENLGKILMWHELFHVLTRNNPDFRRDMYSIIHFTVADHDFEIPPVVLERLYTNPDVNHYDSYASFLINGEYIDCFFVTIIKKPSEQKGKNLFENSEPVLVPIGGENTYYSLNDAENLIDVVGENTDYLNDPEECMADNFAFTLYYDLVEDFMTPEIIYAIADYLSQPVAKVNKK